MSIQANVSGARFEAVPRILHQTWKTEEIPPAWSGFRRGWIERHPDWEHRLWTDRDIEQLVARHSPEMLDDFRSFPRDIQRVDAAKLLILQAHGGVYADLDTECLQPVEPLLAGGGMVLSRTRDGVIEGAFMAAPPQHAFCDRALRRMRSPGRLARIFLRMPGFQATGVLLSTGPLMLHRELKAFRTSSGSKVDGVRVLDARYCSQRSWWHRHRPFENSPDSYVRHHHADSWLLPLERAVVHFARPGGVLGTLVIAAALIAVLAIW